MEGKKEIELFDFVKHIEENSEKYTSEAFAAATELTRINKFLSEIWIMEELVDSSDFGELINPGYVLFQKYHDTALRFLKEDEEKKENFLWLLYEVDEQTVSMINSIYSDIFSLDKEWAGIAPIEYYEKLKLIYEFNGGSYFIPNLVNEAEKFKQSLFSLEGDLGILKNGIAETSGKVLAKNYAKIFSDASEKYEGVKNQWFKGAISGMILLITVIWIFHNILPITGMNQIIILPNLITKLFIISLNVYLINVCVRQFSANRHQQSINDHRANAMNSYDMLSNVIGTTDEESKKQLALLLAKSIYENNQTTGFLSRKGGSETNILDVKSFFSSGSGGGS